jgi:hypothetical protein
MLNFGIQTECKITKINIQFPLLPPERKNNLKKYDLKSMVVVPLWVT